MGDAQHRLGLSCPKEGQFYICDNANIRFIGCCSVDPCTEERGGECPTDSLRPSSFSSDAYNQIGQQSCFSPESEDIWYTCKASDGNPTPFLGCCKSNPCSADGCATKDLYPARLSDNPDKAEIFLSDASSPDPSGDSTSLGTILGGVFGGLAFVGIIAMGFLLYRRGWLGKKKKSEKEADEAAGLYAYSPFQSQYSPGLPSNWPGSQPGSPGLVYPAYSSQMYQGNNNGPSTASNGNPDSRHVSQMSSLTWEAVAANVARKHYSQLSQGPPPTELDGGELAAPSQTHHTSELDGRATEIPRVVAELPAADRTDHNNDGR